METSRDFIEGIIAGLGMLGGLCAFNYWIFSMMEKRIESKVDGLGVSLKRLENNIHTLGEEIKEERRARDKLYAFVLDSKR